MIKFFAFIFLVFSIVALIMVDHDLAMGAIILGTIYSAWYHIETKLDMILKTSDDK